MLQVIERFSEDIDLVVLREEAESGHSLTRKKKAVSRIVGAVLDEVAVEGITNKSGRLRKTVHQYPKTFAGDFGQVRDFIVLEASMLGNFEPYHTMDISSFIYDMMMAQAQEPLADEYQLLPFAINVLDVRRTICEKIMSLVRFSYEEDAIATLKNKIRHAYDIHALLKLEEIIIFFESEDFDQMLRKVGNDDVDSFRNNNGWLVNHPAQSLIFNKPEETWSALATTYHGSFAGLVYGKLPDASHIATDLRRVSERLKKVEWNINLDQ